MDPSGSCALRKRRGGAESVNSGNVTQLPYFHDSNTDPFLLKDSVNICARVTLGLKTEIGCKAASSIAIRN